MSESLTLATIQDGAAEAMFARALSELMVNVLDVNTSPKVKRKITLSFDFEPNTDRTATTLSINCDTKLAPPLGVNALVFVGRNSAGKVEFAEHNPKQPGLFGGAPAVETAAIPKGGTATITVLGGGKGQ